MRRWMGQECWALVASLGLVVTLAAVAGAQGRARVEAYAGEPFGVGRLEIDLPEAQLPAPLGLAGLGIVEKNGRVFYPAIESRAIAGVVKDVLGQARRPALRLLGEAIDRGRTSLYFLFQGREPLELAIQSRRTDALTLEPLADPGAHRRLLAAWWRQYSASPLLLPRPDYPPLVENYLRAMLGRRLSLAPSMLARSRSWEDLATEELRLIGETEQLRIAYQRARFLGSEPAETADQPLPKPIEITDIEVPEPGADVEIEPLAKRVPAECFYVRFGSFANFLWLQDMMDRWGGDFRNLAAARGLDYGTRDRIQSQLVLQTTLLSRLFGDQVIGDVAIVGTDFLFQDGAAYGLLFQARNSTVLALNLNQQRQERVRAGNGILERKVTLDGHEISFLSSPDGSVRSYYAADGDYHFVTTSKTLAKRFLETRSGKGSLAAAKEFCHARCLMPLKQNHAVFVYLSSRFFENYVSPAYRTEMIRRMKAHADIELAQLALLASATEKKPDDAPEALVAEGFLPPGFGPRPDGSRTVIVESEARDTLRGERGQFVPVPDVEVQGVTPSEAEAYQRFVEFYQSRWQRLNPVVACIRREPASGERECVTIDVRMTPLAKPQYETLTQWVGAADPRHLAPIPGDGAAVEIVLPRQRVFAGLQAMGPALEIINGDLLPFGRLRNLFVGYVGTTGDLGLLGYLNRRVVSLADPSGYAQGEAGLWRRQMDPFTVFSFQRDLLEQVTAQLRYEEAERPAQVRARLADLSNARITPFVNTWGYRRTRETSLGNLRLMQQMIQQFHVPPERAQVAAELLLDAKLTCPLGGQYAYRRTPDGSGCWTSTALEGDQGTGRPPVPDGYLAPPLNWFRGLDLDARLEPETLSVHARLEMQLPPGPRKL